MVQNRHKIMIAALTPSEKRRGGSQCDGLRIFIGQLFFITNSESKIVSINLCKVVYHHHHHHHHHHSLKIYIEMISVQAYALSAQEFNTMYYELQYESLTTFLRKFFINRVDLKHNFCPQNSPKFHEF